MKHFTSGKRFASWLGQCPDNRITGGQVKGTKTRSVNHPLATALRMAAMTLWRSNTYLGDYCRKMKIPSRQGRGDHRDRAQAGPNHLRDDRHRQAPR